MRSPSWTLVMSFLWSVIIDPYLPRIVSHNMLPHGLTPDLETTLSVSLSTFPKLLLASVYPFEYTKEKEVLLVVTTWKSWSE